MWISPLSALLFGFCAVWTLSTPTDSSKHIKRCGSSPPSSPEYNSQGGREWECGDKKIRPKVFVINLYDMEGESWYGNDAINFLAHNITVPGLSPLFPDIHCTSDFAACQLIAGEGEINAATSITALIYSDLFDLRKTYFLVSGVAGVNPTVSTIASVTFARYAVQVALQYEFDPRNLPSNFSTGYIPQGSTAPDQYPQELYGTEVFELNDALRSNIMNLVKAARVTLADSSDAQAYRAKFDSTPRTSNGTNIYAAATAPPSVVACDTTTADVFWSGTLLNDAFANYTALITNGTGVYCTSQQEDNAILEPMLRGTLSNRTDFARIIVMRTASDFEAPPPGVSDFDNLIYAQSGYIPALKNIPIAGVPIVEGIIKNWNTEYEKGIKPNNYIGDIFGSLGGTPNFGPGSIPEPESLTTLPFQRHKRNIANILGRSVSRPSHRRSKGNKAQLLPRMRINV